MSGRIGGSADGSRMDGVWQALWRAVVTTAFVCCVLFIWHNSMESAEVSSGRSGRVLEIVNDILEPVGREVFTEHFVRKLAHFMEYGAEGILTVLLFWAYRFGRRRGILLMLLVGLATAVIDESIQFFSPGRAPGILDVCIDMEGFICGMLFVLMLGILHDKAKRRADNG